MKTELIDIYVSPDHLIIEQHGGDDESPYFHAMFRDQPSEVLGCPLGRGPTRQAALQDLKRRVEIESPVILHISAAEPAPQPKPNNKICPLMSRVVKKEKPERLGAISTHFELEPIECQRGKCQFWIEVYSTENRLQDGDCAIALRPQMVDGLLRV